MSQLWGLIHKPDTEQQDHNQQRSSSSSASTIESDNLLDSATEYYYPASEDSFNIQLRKKLSDLTLKKKKKLKKPLQCETTKSNEQQHSHSSSTDHKAEIDELNDELKEIEPITAKQIPPSLQAHTEPSSTVLSPSASYLSTSSSNIFERSVQDQATMSSISRRSSFNQANPSFTSHSFTSLSSPTHSHSTFHQANNAPSNKIPDHLNSEVFIPTCLDATTEVLTNCDRNVEDVEVIRSSNPCFTDVLDQTYYQKKKGTTSPTLSRRQTANSIYYVSPTSHQRLQQFDQDEDKTPIPPFSLTKSPTNPLSRYPSNTLSRKDSVVSTSNEGIDYSDPRKLNFCSFADLLSEELLENQSTADELEHPSRIDSVLTSPVSRRNSSLFISPMVTRVMTSDR